MMVLIMHFPTGFFVCFRLATPHSLWDLGSPTMDTLALALKAPSPNHWTTKELPSLLFCAGQGQDDSFTCPAQQLKMLINSKFFIMSNLYLSCFNTFPFSSLSSVNRGD